jgi:phage baseplate assembly protein W
MRTAPEKEFLGQGLAFPLQLNARGGLALAAGVRDIEQSIRIILETLPGERVMRPEFGCRAKELVFAPRNTSTESLMVQYVEQALGRWEPRIAVLQVEAQASEVPDGGWLVEIRYRVKDTHDERSLVYPFFIGAEV